VILLLVEGVLEQEQPEAMMIRLLLFLLLFCGPALARGYLRMINRPAAAGPAISSFGEVLR
jgi:hypothetical protein